MIPSSEPVRTNKGGRPRAKERGVNVSAWLRESEYDKLIRLAKMRREPVSSLVRSLLILRLPPVA